jgi:hypothetical protein
MVKSAKKIITKHKKEFKISIVFKPERYKYIIFVLLRTYEKGEIQLHHHILKNLYEISKNPQSCIQLISTSYELSVDKQMLFNNFYILLYKIADGYIKIIPENPDNILNLHDLDKEIQSFASLLFLNLLTCNCETVISNSNIHPNDILTFLEKKEITDNSIISCLQEMIKQDKEMYSTIERLMDMN